MEMDDRTGPNYSAFDSITTPPAWRAFRQNPRLAITFGVILGIGAVGSTQDDRVIALASIAALAGIDLTVMMQTDSHEDQSKEDN
jgi:hypothetical protein